MRPPLLLGEVIVDVTVTPRGAENKLRLGGITHAARGFWALGVPFSAAAIIPEYLEKSARRYFSELGCRDFSIIGRVQGSPNVALIFDPTEVDDQEYDFLLREEKEILLSATFDGESFAGHRDVLIYPGTYDLAAIQRLIPKEAKVHVDAAYDIQSVEHVRSLGSSVATVFISTSSRLFQQTGMSGIDELAKNFESLKLEAIVLKENRGGSRIRIYSTNETVSIPAQLGTTVNSVGVGDVYDAAYLAYHDRGLVEAAWRAASVSSAYAQTTEPDVFQTYVHRELKLSLEELRDLGGTYLSWEARQAKQIYLAGPDFKNLDRSAIERAVSALEYHNFKVRRPVKENGEVPPNSDHITLGATFRKDVDLMDECRLVFAIPTARDPGTLVEIGLAIEKGIPVVVYDPSNECANTMVIAGSECYSSDLDECLNAVFNSLSKGASPQ